MSSMVNANICKLDSLYSDGFAYPTPKEMVESFLDGNAFDYKKSYTAEERKALEMDINALYDRICRGAQKKSAELVATVTAGSPGTGKTIVMKQVMQKDSPHAAYIDPDDVCLKSMSLTYGAELASGLAAISKQQFDSVGDKLAAEKQLRTQLYTKWRPASNGANHAILGNLVREKYDVFFGSTSSSPVMGKFFHFFKDHGYKVRILHVSAPDSVRWDSIKERDKTFVQTTEQDILEKGDLVPQRIQDTYLKLADEIQFFFRAGVHEDAVLAATWIRSSESGKPVLTVVNSKAYEEVKKVHDAVCSKLNRPDIHWNAAVESNSFVR